GIFCCFFFFSSRRRHTRFDCDWSSDVCSSDLLGGENSFGLGGYFRTPIEEVLPVSLEVEKKQDQPSLALALVVDKSGSMSGNKRSEERRVGKECRSRWVG